MTQMPKVMFIRDFEEHKAGDVVEMTLIQTYNYQELGCIEVLEISVPDPQSEPVAPSKPKAQKKAK